MARPEYLVIITGLSGSGKSYVQSTLEDVGFYCSDNLPIALIEPFLEEVGEHENAVKIYEELVKEPAGQKDVSLWRALAKSQKALGHAAEVAGACNRVHALVPKMACP